MITWVSKESDFNDIEPPLITENGLFIQYYHKTPLYHGLVKNEIDITGSKPEAIEAFKNDIRIHNVDLKVLTFKTNKVIKLEELPWVKRLLSIILFKLNYNIYNINHEFNHETTFIPTVQITPYNQPAFTEYIYNNIDINIDELIGYKPLIDLFDDQVSLDIASSDFIWDCDLDSYQYEIIHNIPVIKVNGKEDLSLKAKYVEFSMNPMLKIQTNIYSKMTTSNNFIVGDWIFKYKSNIKTIAYLKYATIKSYVETFNTLNGVNDIKVGFDLLIKMPKSNNEIKHKISEYMNHKPFVYITNKNNAIFNAMENNFMAFPIYNQWAVVGDHPITIKNTSRQFNNDIVGLKLMPQI